MIASNTIAVTGSGRALRYQTIDVDGVEIFYREAGPALAPAILLLHGFPSSSHEFRHLMPALADRFHLIAPDLPGFGFSAFPYPSVYPYSFERLAGTIDGFVTAVGLEKFALYMHDYGAQVGFRIALRKPDRITTIACQNSEAYEAGFCHEPLKAYWRDPNQANLDRLRKIVTEAGIKAEFVGGLPHWQVPFVSPEMWKLHWPLIDRPGNREMQLHLFDDYRTNLQLHPAIHQYFRTYRPPALILWGRHEIYYTTDAAHAYSTDLPDAEIRIFDAGHWALETHTAEVIALVRDFYLRKIPGAWQSMYPLNRNEENE